MTWLKTVGRLGLWGLMVGVAWAEPAAPAAAASGANEPTPPTPEQLAELHAIAEGLWNDYVPEPIKAEYELIGRDELIALFTRVETAGQEENLETYAGLAPETRAAIAALRTLPDYAEYAEWLEGQLADMEVARQVTRPTAPPPPAPVPRVPVPGKLEPKRDAPPPKEEGERADIPLYGLWLERVAARPRPARADEWLPVVRAEFAAQGVPEALVWLAEVESSFNPRARSPVGARGLFQIMPKTATSLGLSLWPFDQRVQPQASARAAAIYLRQLHRRFGDWPLTLAAYNGGPGRVARTLKARGATDFAGIAEHLPAETRLYVPKVLATVRVRAGVPPEGLAAPGAETAARE